jgi:hypothetical protein
LLLPPNKHTTTQAHLVAKFEAIFCRYFRWRDRPNIARPNIDQISPETSVGGIDFSGGFGRYLVDIFRGDIFPAATGPPADHKK